MGHRKDTNGNNIGTSPSKETRLKISRAHLERFEQQPKPSPPALKLCGNCGEWKDRGTEFGIKNEKRRLANGKIKVYKYATWECKDCRAMRSAAHRQKLIDEGKYAEKVQEWEGNRDRERMNAVHRDWYRKKRGKAFTRPWKKYRRGYVRRGTYYRIDEVLTYFKRFMYEDDDGAKRLNGMRLSSSETRALSRWETGESKLISEFSIDVWATRFDLPLWEIEEDAVRAN